MKPPFPVLHIPNFKSVQPRMEEGHSRSTSYHVGYENAKASSGKGGRAQLLLPKLWNFVLMGLAGMS